MAEFHLQQQFHPQELCGAPEHKIKKEGKGTSFIAVSCFLLQVREFVKDTGIENLGKRLVNSKEGKVEFERPSMNVDTLLKCALLPLLHCNSVPHDLWQHPVSLVYVCHFWMLLCDR